MVFESIVGTLGNNRWFLAFIAFAAFYLAFRVLTSSSSKRSGNYQKELDSVIHSDEYKVKGKFE